MRGNHTLNLLKAARQGSIPACAGEPFRPFHIVYIDQVYPRVCGGTLIPVFLDAILAGLSPCVRGNH